MKPRIRKLVQGVHMGLGHDGLRKLLDKELGFNVDNLTNHDLIMLLNTKGDKMKVIGCKGLVFGYLKMPKGQRIMKEALQFIPATFGSSGFDYDAACEKALKARLQEYYQPRGPLAAQRKQAESQAHYK